MNYLYVFIIASLIVGLVNYKYMFNKYKSFILKKVTNKTMKTSTLVNSVDNLNSLLNEPVLDDKGVKTGEIAKALPATLSFKLALLLKEIDPILTTFNKVRVEKVKELGTPVQVDGKDTEQYEFTDENGKKFAEELQKMGDEEITIKIPEIKIAELGDIMIEPAKLISLDWLILA